MNPIYRTLIVLVTMGVVFLAACSDDPVKPRADADHVRGVVTDAQGTPVSGAAILLCYDVPTPFAARIADKPATGIEFVLPVATSVRVWVTEPCHDDLVREIHDGELPAGSYRFIWDAKNQAGDTVTEGQYLLNIAREDLIFTSETFLLMVSYAGFTSADGYEVFATTDEQGRFSISQECLDFGAEIQLYNETGEPMGEPYIVPRRLTVWAVSEGYTAASGPRKIVVSATSGVVADITLEERP